MDTRKKTSGLIFLAVTAIFAGMIVFPAFEFWKVLQRNDPPIQPYDVMKLNLIAWSTSSCGVVMFFAVLANHRKLHVEIGEYVLARHISMTPECAQNRQYVIAGNQDVIPAGLLEVVLLQIVDYAAKGEDLTPEFRRNAMQNCVNTLINEFNKRVGTSGIGTPSLSLFVSALNRYTDACATAAESLRKVYQ